MLALIRDQLRARGQTILLTDHQSAEMEVVADRIAVLREGAIALEGTPRALLQRLAHLTVIEAHTEEMDLPTTPPPEGIVAAEQTERPGALGLRVWRVHAHKRPDALETVLRWIEQPRGRIVLLAESAPTLRDVLALPEHAPPDTATHADEPAHEPVAAL